jgi:hypothetical protein
MTTQLSATKREVDDLIQQQIIILRQSSSLSPSALAEFHVRSTKISRLFRELDRSKPLPPYPVHKSRHRVHPSL